MQKMLTVFFMLVIIGLTGCATSPQQGAATHQAVQPQLSQDSKDYPWNVDRTDNYGLAYLCTNCAQYASTLYRSEHWPANITPLERKLWSEIILTYALFENEEKQWAGTEARKKRQLYRQEIATLALDTYGRQFADDVLTRIDNRIVSSRNVSSPKSPFRLPSQTRTKPRQDVAIMMTLTLRNALASSRMSITELNKLAREDLAALDSAYRKMMIMRTYTPPMLEGVKDWMRQEVKWRMAGPSIYKQYTG